MRQEHESHEKTSHVFNFVPKDLKNVKAKLQVFFVLRLKIRFKMKRINNLVQ